MGSDWPPYFYIKNRQAVEMPTEHIEGHPWFTEDDFYSGKWKPGKIAPNFRHVEVTPRLTVEAIKYIDKSANKEKPFFLYFALPSPHGQLYDLSNDPSEQTNLWDVKPEIVQKMRLMFEEEKHNKKNDRIQRQKRREGQNT